MSHSAHRCGNLQDLKNDYVIYARTSRWVNREGCGPKLRKILGIFLDENPVNFGSSHSGKSFAAGLDPDEYAETLDKGYAVACCFSDPAAVRNVLRKLAKAEVGISIVVSGLVDDIRKMAQETGLKPHTALLSMGIHGRTDQLPDEKVLEVTTMCGHGLVATDLVEDVARRVRAGDMTPEEGTHLLAQPCPCGIFNLDRCTRLLEVSRGSGLDNGGKGD